MSISAVSSTQSHAVVQSSAKLAPDGDTQAVEAAESAATRQAEKLNGGFAPKAPATTSPFSVNKLV